MIKKIVKIKNFHLYKQKNVEFEQKLKWRNRDNISSFLGYLSNN